MQKSRKYICDVLQGTKSLKNRHEYLQKDFVRTSGQESHDATMKYYDSLIDKLTQEIESLPIGYRFTGTFYVKIPYSAPTELEDVTGSAFMREDLVSWMIEGGLLIHNQYYYRAIFRERNLQSEIKREDALPIYDKIGESVNAQAV